MPAPAAPGRVSPSSSAQPAASTTCASLRDWRPALDDGRLLVLSPFPATYRRPTAELAAQRNDLVADLATRVVIAHAAPGSKTEAFARDLAASSKPLLTLDSPANANLVAMGAEEVDTELWELKGQELNSLLDAKDTSQRMLARFSLR